MILFSIELFQHWVWHAVHACIVPMLSSYRTCSSCDLIFGDDSHTCCYFALVGDIHQAEVWSDEEGVWTECSVWLWDCTDNVQQCQQVVSVCQHRHGSSVAQVYWPQWPTGESHQQRHRWGEHVLINCLYMNSFLTWYCCSCLDLCIFFLFLIFTFD